jgi:hypothetical protein
MIKDIFTLCVRVMGLIFLWLGIHSLIGLLNIDAIRMTSGSDLVSAIIPAIFNFAVSMFLLGTQGLIRLAFPAPARRITEVHQEPERPAPTDANKKLASLVTISCLMLCCISSQAASQFVWIMHGDDHAGLSGSTSSNEFGGMTNFVLNPPTGWNVWNGYTNQGTISGNITMGDLFEQTVAFNGLPTDPTYAHPTNEVNFISNSIAAGLLTVACDGNHDADDFTGNSTLNGTRGCVTGAEWNTWVGTNIWMRSPYFGGVHTANDSRQLYQLYTNGPLTFVIVTLQWPTNVSSFLTNATDVDMYGLFSNQLAWASNTMASFPDHLGVLVTHYMLNKYGAPEFWDTGGSLYTNIGPGKVVSRFLPSNLWLILSGHNRTSLTQHFAFPVSEGNGLSHYGYIIQWDTQGISPHVEMVNVLTFSPDLKRVDVGAFDISLGRYMTNGETRLVGSQGVPNAGGNFTYSYKYSMQIPALGLGLKNLFRAQ